jgi:hypothetical protein
VKFKLPARCNSPVPNCLHAGMNVRFGAVDIKLEVIGTFLLY